MTDKLESLIDALADHSVTWAVAIERCYPTSEQVELHNKCEAAKQQIVAYCEAQQKRIAELEVLQKLLEQQMKLDNRVKSPFAPSEKKAGLNEYLIKTIADGRALEPPPPIIMNLEQAEEIRRLREAIQDALTELYEGGYDKLCCRLREAIGGR